MKQDEKIATFLSMTNTENNDLAFQILQNNNWNLEESLNEFFSGNHNTTSSIPKKTLKRRRSVEDEDERIETLNDDDNVRAPIPPVRTVVSENPSGYADSHSRKKPVTIFRGLEVNNKADPKLVQLRTLFSPPLDILFTQSFQEAKHLGSLEGKWILANIQADSEFDSHLLNRDTWSNKELKETIKEHFIFWQRFFDSPEGSKYCRFYPVADLKPHIGIIDPRTGELMKYWAGFKSPNELHTQLTLFLNSHSLPKLYELNESSNSTSNKEKKSIVDCTEDEQLAAAIAASLEQTNQKAEIISSSSESEHSEEGINLEESEEEKLFSPEEKTIISQEEKTIISQEEKKIVSQEEKTIISEEEEKPEDSSIPYDCFIQIRESNGNILKGSFHSFDKLEKVYKFIQKNGSDGHKKFSLMSTFPKRIFSTDQFSKTLKELDLVPRAVLIVSID